MSLEAVQLFPHPTGRRPGGLRTPVETERRGPCARETFTPKVIYDGDAIAPSWHPVAGADCTARGGADAERGL